ncbi:unnamed protein product, partial [Prorocentrum cordatum]
AGDENVAASDHAHDADDASGKDFAINNHLVFFNSKAVPAGNFTYKFGILVSGRAAMLTCADISKGITAKLLNAHNYNWDESHFSAIAAKMGEAHAKAHPESHEEHHRYSVAIGDFNISDQPVYSYDTPTATWSAATPHARADGNANAWRQLFRTMTEFPTGQPTRFSKATRTASAIDRAFISTDEHALLHNDISYEINREAVALSNARLSDHALVVLRLRETTVKPLGERAMPSLIFKMPRYRHHNETFYNLSSIQHMGVEGRWRATKILMREAARLTRDEAQQCRKDDISDFARQGRLITARAISRAVWQNNTPTAELLIATTTLGKEQLLIHDTMVALLDPR